MDKAIGVVTLSFMVLALGIVVSKRTQTAKVLTSLFSGIASLQKGATSGL